MALIHRAQLVPSKLELLAGWLPGQGWFTSADISSLAALGAYRFDDPAGEVGIETHLLTTSDGRVWQVPLTYRAQPLDIAGAAFVGTMQHSVLGERFVYDGCGDPVYAGALATAILTGGREAELEVAGSDGERREATTRVTGSGSPGTAVPPVAAVTTTTEGTITVIRCDALELGVVRDVDAAAAPSSSHTLVGTWPARDTATLLAFAR